MNNKVVDNSYSNGGLMYWIKNHQFWASVIILSIIFLLLCILLILLRYSPRRLILLPIGLFLVAYAFFGGITWSINAKKTGMSLLVLVSFSSLAAIYFWGQLLFLSIHTDSAIHSIAFAIPFTLLGIVFLFVGIKRYKNGSKGEITQY